MLRWRHCTSSITLAVVLALTPLAVRADNKNDKAKAAQEKRDDQKIKNEKEDVKQAQEKLKDDQKELQAAQKAVDEAERKETAARKRLDEVRKRVEAKHENASGIDKALAAQEAAKKSYDAAAAPVLKSLKEKPEYQAIVKKVADAEARLKAAQDDKNLSADAKRAVIARASKDKLATSELERTALEANPAARSARAKLADAQAYVTELRSQIRGMIDNDSEIKSAREAMRSAADATEAVGEKMKRIRDRASADAAKLNPEQQQVKQAEAADKANDNQNKTIKNKNKPK